MRGRDARLPCGQGKVFLDGPDSFILWLKNDREFLYRFPNEDSNKRIGHRNHVFGTTCESGVCHDDTSLLIKKISNREAGIYRCRVHYQASPSVDYVVDVRLVEPPGMPKLYSGDGGLITLGYVGPLSLGSDLILTCEVKDKAPETEVYWRRNGLIKKRAYVYQPGVLRVDLHLTNLTRADLDAHYECLAQNSDVTEPFVAAVVIKMYLPPMSVEIRLNNNFDFEAGQPRVVDCVVIGCVPTPTITWHLGDNMLRPTVHKELHDGNYTVSSLTLAPSLRDDQKELVCRAHNAHLPAERFMDKVTLTVGYRPVCQMGREEKIGAVVKEAEKVTCTVDASPEPLQFSWTFADSTTLYTTVTKVSGYSHRYTSTLTWLSREGDIGQLQCRATNAFGEQKRPCTFNIASGGPPALPDCHMTRTYPNALRAQCKKGWDGGRPQRIHLEVLDEEGTPIRNVTDVAGHFFLPDMVFARNMTAVLYATNSRGKSAERVISLQSLEPPPASALNNYMTSTWMPYVEALVGTLAFMIAIVSITLGTKILIARRQSVPMNPDVIPRNDGGYSGVRDGVFHREPDFIRDERLLGRTNITVNQLATCQNQYSSSPLPACRVLVDCGTHSSADSCPPSPHSYYV
uniref:Ig-like domain-containing protein n=1 Tax=Heliothis virescens TaxID=7102 RepID=A0A2A4K4V5_HELVI